MALLEDQLRPLVEAESSLLVDIMYHPHLLFAPESENRKRASNGGFVKKFVILFFFFFWEPSRKNVHRMVDSLKSS